MTKHIIIVDDNSLLRKTVLEILNNNLPNVNIFEASSGMEMWQIIQKQIPDLVLMDIRLTNESGLQLTQEIKARHPDVVIVIFTNHDLPEYRKQAQICGAEYFLSKFDSNAEDLTLLVSGVFDNLQPSSSQNH